MSTFLSVKIKFGKVIACLKTAVLCSAVFLFPVFLAGCGSHEDDGKTEIKVAFWGSPADIEIITGALKPWEASHPDVKVRFEHTPYSGYDSKILTRLAGGSAPDVIATEVDYFVTFASKDVFVDLNPYVKSDPAFKTSDFFPSIMERFTVDGKLFVVPRDVAPFACIYYNKDLFDQAGVSYPTDEWTWDDLVEKAKALTVRDPKSDRVRQYGFYAWAWQDFVYGNGGALVDDVSDPTESRLGDPKTIEGLQFYSDLIHVHRVMPTPMAMVNSGMGIHMMFTSGRLAMFLSGIWETPELRQKKDLRWDIAMFPKNAEGIRGFGSGGTGYGILKSSQHPELSWEIVKALTGPEVQAELARRGLAQPSRIAVAKGDAWAGDPAPPDNKDMLNDAVKYTVFDPFHPRWREIRAKYLEPQLDLLKSGKVTAREMVDNIDEEVNQLLQPV